MWVKNVNNHRITRSIRGVLLSPINISSVRLYDGAYGKQLFIRQTVHIYTMLFSTYQIVKNHQLFSIYPHNPQGLLLEPLKRI